MLHIKKAGRKATESIDENSIISEEKDSRIRITVFGDSNAYRPENGSDCWLATLHRKSGKTFCVMNESLERRTTHYDKGPCNGLNVIEKKIRGALPLNLVNIALGNNDIKLKCGPPDTAEVAFGIESLVKIIKKVDSGIEPILLTPPPLGI